MSAEPTPNKQFYSVRPAVNDPRRHPGACGAAVLRVASVALMTSPPGGTVTVGP